MCFSRERFVLYTKDFERHNGVAQKIARRVMQKPEALFRPRQSGKRFEGG